MMPLFLVLGLSVAGQPPLPPPAARPIELPVPQPMPLPAPQAIPVPAAQVPVALTLAEFSRTFTPLPGKHQVWFIHPSTGKPVLVCFTLPEGRMKRFEVDDRWIDFKFDKRTVSIDFRRSGKVEVEE
ncbi:MAG: hypothetical protein C0467_10185 [Planctomycetaceae bacterium]|nr:hypothetical protein [Planctomycetaceae bacterium]